MATLASTVVGGIGTLPKAVLVEERIHYLDDLWSIRLDTGIVKLDRGGNDTLTGTSGVDYITTHNGNDIAYGLGGNDIFFDLKGGNDQFFGGDGHDVFHLGAGTDLADGGLGIDTVDYSGIAYTVTADLDLGFAFADGIDRFVSIENVVGASGNDSIKGNLMANQLSGADGNDLLVGRGGADVLFGGNGNDTLMGNDGNNTAEGNRDLGANDRLYGDAGNDKLMGDAGDDWLDGGVGDDTLIGGMGNDTLIGSGGNDTMTGGTGVDKFLFYATSDMPKADRITDFQHGVDKIDVSHIDANPLVAGDQAFVFDWWGTPITSGSVSVHPGPLVQGMTGHIDVVYQAPPTGTVGPGKTWVYIETNDHVTGASIMLDGHITLTASDFIL